MSTHGWPHVLMCISRRFFRENSQHKEKNSLWRTSGAMGNRKDQKDTVGIEQRKEPARKGKKLDKSRNTILKIIGCGDAIWCTTGQTRIRREGGEPWDAQGGGRNQCRLAPCREILRGDSVSPLLFAYLVNLRNLILCGVSASLPRRFLRSSSYSL